MVKFDDVTKENIKEDNPNWPQISNHQYRKLIAGGSGFRKTNSLFNLKVTNRILINQSINCLLTNEEVQDQSLLNA